MCSVCMRGYDATRTDRSKAPFAAPGESAYLGYQGAAEGQIEIESPGYSTHRITAVTS